LCYLLCTVLFGIMTTKLNKYSLSILTKYSLYYVNNATQFQRVYTYLTDSKRLN